MHVIGPRCRLRFVPSDYEFVAEQLASGEKEKEALYRLLGDSEGCDRILDNERLFHALLEEDRLVSVSTPFYFYIMVRRVFLRAGLAERTLADYVASVLSDFSRLERIRRPAGGRLPVMDYLTDMMAAMQDASEELRFFMSLHIGNVALFLSGIYAEHIGCRSRRRGAPGIDYYETLGESHLRVAGGHRLAGRYDLTPVVGELADVFRPARSALNQLADRFLFVGEG